MHAFAQKSWDKITELNNYYYVELHWKNMKIIIFKCLMLEYNPSQKWQNISNTFSKNVQIMKTEYRGEQLEIDWKFGFVFIFSQKSKSHKKVVFSKNSVEN